MSKTSPLISIITVNYNGKKHLKSCMDSIFDLDHPKSKLEVILVDNGSTDGSVEFVKEKYLKVKILLNDINNYCRANNLGIKQAKGKYIALINNDVKVDKDWLIELIKVIESDQRIGAVTGKILFMDDKRIQTTGHQEYPNFYWGDRGFQEEDRGQYNKIEEIPSICGCSVLYRKECLNNVGLFDEDFIMYMEDVDMSIRCRKNNWKLLYVPTSIIYHRYLGSANQDLQDFYVERNRLLFIVKHYPEKLPEALFGRGYFVTANKENFFRILNDVLLKLIKHHNKKIMEKIMPHLIENLERIENLDKDFLAKKSYQLEGILKQQEDILKKYEEKFKDLDNQITQLNDQISQRDNQLRQLNEQIAQLNSQIKGRDEEIARANDQISQRDNQLRQLNDQISQRDNQLRQLNDQISQRDNRLRQLNEQVVQLNNQLKQRDEQISNLYSKIKEKECLIEQRENELNRAKKELNDIYTSTGFRYLLRPLWTILWNIKVLIKRIKRRLHLIYSHYHFYFKKIIKIIVNIIKINKLKNKKLSIDEILDDIRNKKNVPKEKPKIIHITITSRCNLTCKQCDIWKTEDNRRELTTPEWKIVIEKLHRWIGEFDLHISGGEPFLRKDLLLELIRFSAKKGIRTFTTTNGTFITENIVKELVDAGLFGINVSLDSSDPNKFNYIRSANIYDLILRNLSFLCKYREKLCITIAAVIMGYNIDEIVELVNLVKNKKIANRIVFQPLNQNFSARFVDDWYKSNEFWTKDIKKMTDVLNELITMKQNGAPIDNPVLQLELMKIYFKDPKELIRKWQCNSGDNNLNITINGDALLCWSLDPIGNLLKDSPAEFWLSKTAKERRAEITACKRHCSLLNCNFTDFFYAQYL